MTGILVIYLLLGTQLANMMTHGAHLRRRLPEVRQSVSSSAIDILFSHNLLIPDNVQVTTDRGDETTSNTEEHLLTSISKYLSPEQTNEYISIELEHPNDPVTYENEQKSFIPEEYQPLLDLELFTAGAYSFSDPLTYESDGKALILIPEQYQPLLDHKLFTAGAHSVGDTTVPDDYSQDYYDHPTEYYQEDFTDDYYPYQSPLEYSDGSEAA